MMKLLSPIKDESGNRKPLQKVTLEQGLTGYQCPTSDGVYIPLAFYSDWLRKQPAKLEHLPESVSETAVAESDNPALLCPETGTLMSRFQVGHGFQFTIDRSSTGGIWLDAGEWEELKQRQFHDELHLVFTAPWQKNARDLLAAKHTEERLKERFGDELLAEIQQLKAKLAAHEYRDYAIAYIDA